MKVISSEKLEHKGDFSDDVCSREWSGNQVLRKDRRCRVTTVHSVWGETPIWRDNLDVSGVLGDWQKCMTRSVLAQSRVAFGSALLCGEEATLRGVCTVHHVTSSGASVTCWGQWGAPGAHMDLLCDAYWLTHEEVQEDDPSLRAHC